ncbi:MULTISPECIES: aldehyde dehydrogenase [Nitratireductor]|uniref:aldehyde dehydrogenase n=1 Tax=Nitratireductor TaxID=245876 RepID=UPI0019D34542|nr:aldehyde dehydrogenase [Nitratireductor aquimarinus]MBN7776487.1 aldehyde dehydrogenase [Nitratireductor pacificus]MCV0378389.1 aldehyde dehydrogenase [Nitratireductor sp.]MBN7779354.1 aldehyde dehydrogenase [Nitratireductor pacificus]MBN7788161.1 aldehyde dehydrogenase [Nitratireductor aquimarinus]MBY6098208.1 aldehyde dehydrogenase [Nitratireductor aquimarinus]
MIELPQNKLFVAGEWEEGSGAEITSIFPADGSVNRVLRGASVADGERAIERAKKAQADPAWRNLKPHERARFLYAIADGIEANAERISHIQSRDTGKTLRETGALAASAAGTFRYFGAVLESADEALTVQRGDALTMSVHEPLGLVGAITPWNSPIASDAQKVAPALAAGNAVLLKPASWSPLVSLELARIIEASGLPKGLFSVLPGAGREIGNLLVEHPDIAKISFTGGTATGRALAVKAAQKLMPVSLELGGKSPTIVFADADIEQALAGVLFGIFSSTGQSCIAGARLFVERPIYDQFVERLVAATQRLRVGHPFEADTQVAPMVHFDHRDSVAEHVRRAREEGAEVLIGGGAPEGAAFDKGAYYLPTILAGVDNKARICREEVFGPVLVVLPFDSEEDVIAQANDNEYGLACGLWTRDFPKSWRVGNAIGAGTVWINTYKQFSISTPFGGEKESGMGREKGREGLRAYMAQKSFYTDLSGAPHPWAAATVQAK